MIAYDFNGHFPSLLYRILTVIAALPHAPTDLAPASNDDSFSCVHGPVIDNHRSGGDSAPAEPTGRDERERASQRLGMTTTSGSVYYHHDGLGSTVVQTDAAGAKIESYTCDVFGTVSIFDAAGFLQSSSTAGNRFLFTGREWITELGLYDYRNRVYSPDLGRFLQLDPIRFDAGDVNLYRYVNNNPVNLIDPLGLFILNPASGAGEGAAIGTAIFPGPGTVIGAAAGAIIGTAAIKVTADWIMNESSRSRGKSDPVSVPDVDVGRGPDGKYRPCPQPPPPWKAPGNAHGSTCGSHWHWIEYHQNPVTCICHAKRMSGPNPP
jgi:RHS repeat-associated protein